MYIFLCVYICIYYFSTNILLNYVLNKFSIGTNNKNILFIGPYILLTTKCIYVNIIKFIR